MPVKTQLRLTDELYEQLKSRAELSDRSINSEIVHLLKKAIASTEPHATPSEIEAIINRVLMGKSENNPNATPEQVRDIVREELDRAGE